MLSVNYFEKRSKFWIFMFGLASTLSIGLVDYWTGYEVGLSIFYLAPIALVAWFGSREAGILLSIISSVTITFADFLAGKQIQNYLLEVWNTGIHLAFFIIVTVLLSKLKSEFKARKELILQLDCKVRERTEDVMMTNKELEREIIERKGAEERVTKSLKEKEILLRELYHRTKNNMQVISNLLDLQAASFHDKKIAQLFKESQSRIKSMALIHEKLYQSKDLSNVNIKDYIQELAHVLLSTYQLNQNKIVLKLDMDSVAVSIDTAMTSGLIVNELISNSLKYAFPDDGKGEIIITLQRTEKGNIELYFADNGVGFPKGFDFSNSKSLGLKLVKNLTEKQLRGKVSLRTNERPEFLIEFKEPEDLKRI